jgi:mannose-6-phosphate isomerase-like protein (cupin superfamily)
MIFLPPCRRGSTATPSARRSARCGCARRWGWWSWGSIRGCRRRLLSKLEWGRLFPTLPTLLRVALVFGVGLDFFFSGARQKPTVGIVRRKDRLRFPDQPGSPDVAYQFESLDYTPVERRLNAYYAEFFPVAPDQVHLHQHAGGELIYVLSGALVVRIEQDEHVLHAEDSIYFDSGVLHGYRRQGARPCRAIVVTPA